MKIFLFISLFIVVTQCNAQQIRVQTQNFHAWINNVGTINLKNKYQFFHDVQFRRNSFVKNPMQLLLRFGIVKKIRNELSVGGGYAFVQTHPYGDFAVANTFAEHRIWEQLTINQKIGKLTFINRFRLEQRWIGNSNLGGFKNHRYENRIRHMVRGNYPIDKNFYFAAFDEVMLSIGKQVANNDFDQNRLCFLLGNKLSKKVNLELGYMNHFVKLRSRTSSLQNRYESNNNFMLILSSDL